MAFGWDSGPTSCSIRSSLPGRGALLTKLSHWYEPADILRQATRGNAELLALSGPRNPYPARLGVVEAGAIADLILVDGDPVADISLISDPDRNFLAIVKDGHLVKGPPNVN